MNNRITFDGNPIDLKFDNYTIFKMASASIFYNDLFTGKGADPERFCAAWAFMLGVDYDGDQRKFMGRFNNIIGINETVLKALELSGIIEPIIDTDSAKKNEKS